MGSKNATGIILSGANWVLLHFCLLLSFVCEFPTPSEIKGKQCLAEGSDSVGPREGLRTQGKEQVTACQGPRRLEA